MTFRPPVRRIDSRVIITFPHLCFWRMLVTRNNARIPSRSKEEKNDNIYCEDNRNSDNKISMVEMKNECLRKKSRKKDDWSND